MEQPSFFKRIFIGRNKYLTLGIIVILAIITGFLLKNKNDNTLNITNVIRGTITQEVLLTGNVKPLDSVVLAFEKSGKVSSINKNIGESVYAGEIIASLDNGIEEAALKSAEATLKSAEARYEELSKGSRSEDIKVYETAVIQSKQTLENYYGSITDTISDAYNKSDNAVNRQTDAIFSNDQSTNPDLTFNVNSTQMRNDAIAGRVSITETLKSFKSLENFTLSNPQTEDEKDSTLEKTKKYLTETANFLIKVSSTLDNATNLNDTTLATYKDGVATGRTNINIALKAVNDLIEAISSQKIAVMKAEQELTLKKLGATAEVLSQAKASIDQANANVLSAQATLRKTVIRSPIEGIITNQDAKIGEIASANTPLISVMNAKKFKIEAYVPEADSAKLNIGLNAEVTLDAYGNDILFNASLISIDPAERVIDGVSTYKTTFTFINETKPIKSGMTANVTVKTQEKQDVLIIPQRAVSSKNNNKYVSVVNEKNVITEKEIQTGLKGSNGMIEIISGLSEGDRVINYVK